jgi:integrase
MWQMGPMRAGSIAIPRLSTGVKDKTTARAVEQSLRELATSGYADLVEQVSLRKLQPLDLYVARLRGESELERIRKSSTDSLLTDVVAAYKPLASDKRIKAGLKQLLELAPTGARFSYLETPKHLSEMYARAVEAGRMPNSVRRSLHRAVSDLLHHELGRGRMLGIMADVKIPSANDERVVMLSADEIAAVLRHADYEIQPAIGLALTTGIDRGPMLALRARDFDPTTGILWVPDTKTGARPRKLELSPEAQAYVRMAATGRESHEKLFDLTEQQVRSRWEAIREKIGRPDVRWKDFRGIFATYFLEAGGSPRELQNILGHAALNMTLRYVRRLPVRSGPQMGGAAAKMGLGRAHLRIEKGDQK